MVRCPICSEENQAGATACTICGSRLQPEPVARISAPWEQAPRPAVAPATVQRPVLAERKSQRAAWGTAALGVLFTLLTSALFLAAGRLWPRAADLVFERGWIPVATVAVFGWAMAILWSKRRALGQQRGTSVKDLLASHAEIGPDDVAAALNEIQRRFRGKKIALQDHYLARRIWRSLEAFAAQRRVAAAGEALRHASEVDASTIDAGYTLVRVFIWAIPILGFIGTVMGIGDAVQGFSSFIEGVDEVSRLQEQMTPALGAVTSGLSVAFDTTLLALLLSIPTMVLASSIQKREEELLNDVDTETFTLLDRLQEAPHEEPAATDLGALRAAFKELATAAVSVLTSGLDEHSRGINRLIEGSLARHETILIDLLQGPVQALEIRLQETQQVAHDVGRQIEAAAAQARETADQLADSHDRLDGQLAQLGSVTGGLGRTASSLDAVAHQLAQQRGGFASEGDRWLTAFNGSKTELLGTLQRNQEELQAARRWLERPRPIRLKAIELVEESEHGEE